MVFQKKNMEFDIFLLTLLLQPWTIRPLSDIRVQI